MALTKVGKEGITGIDNSSDATAITIDSGESVFIGNTAEFVDGTGTGDKGIQLNPLGLTVSTRNGGVSGIFGRQASDGEIIQFRKDGTSIGAVGITSSTNDIYINSVASNHKGLRFGSGAIVPTDNSGGTDDNATNLGGATQRFSNLYLGGGLFVGGTASANLLDDYEEGTWTPALNQYSGSATISTSNYTKIGRQVVASTTILLDGTSDASNFSISGLPFTAANLGTAVNGGFFTYSTMTFEKPVRLLIGNNTTQINIYTQSGGIASYNGLGNSAAYRLIVIYFT